MVGLFTKPIPEGLPQYGTLLSSLGYFHFTNVHPGTYFLMAAVVSLEMTTKEILVPQRNLHTKVDHPINVAPKTVLSQQRLILRKPRLEDPPILISLPLLMKNFLARAYYNDGVPFMQ